MPKRTDGIGRRLGLHDDDERDPANDPVSGSALSHGQGDSLWEWQAMPIKYALVAMAFLLAGCGASEPGRVQGGAAAGAATGATIGLIGGPPGVAAGAIIGGGAGALTGASTTPQQVDLGKPVWKKP